MDSAADVDWYKFTLAIGTEQSQRATTGQWLADRSTGHGDLQWCSAVVINQWRKQPR